MNEIFVSITLDIVCLYGIIRGVGGEILCAIRDALRSWHFQFTILNIHDTHCFYFGYETFSIHNIFRSRHFPFTTLYTHEIYHWERPLLTTLTGLTIYNTYRSRHFLFIDFTILTIHDTYHSRHFLFMTLFIHNYIQTKLNMHHT